MHFQFSRSWIFVTRCVTGPRASQKCFFVLATSHSHVSTVYAYSGGRALLQAIGLWLEQSCNHLINSLDQQNALLGFSLIDDVNPPRSLMRSKNDSLRGVLKRRCQMSCSCSAMRYCARSAKCFTVPRRAAIN